MNRREFERLRDLPGKVIRRDIRFTRSKATSPAVMADGIAIENGLGVELRMNISVNPEIGAKTINVVEAGVGPICRLDVDGPAHPPAGRGHKHSLQTPECSARNLPDGVVDREDLRGKSLREVFAEFCRLADIHHEGNLESPDEVQSS